MLQGLIGLAGIGMTAFGAYNFYNAENQVSSDTAQMGAEEQQMLSLKQQQAGLEFNRNTRQLARNSIQAQAQGKAAAVASGSQFGSGAAGAKGQIQGEAGTQAVNLSQNYQLGTAAFGVASQEINTATQMGVARTEASTGQGEMSLGGAITGSSGTLSNMATQGGSWISSLLSAPTFGAGMGW